MLKFWLACAVINFFAIFVDIGLTGKANYNFPSFLVAVVLSPLYLIMWVGICTGKLIKWLKKGKKTMIAWLKEKFRREPKRWFVSDIHFGHRNVINYCNRPYKDVETMNKAIIKIWNKTVKKQDTVYFLGDFSLNPKLSKTFTRQLNGRKIMVAGNHDSCHISHKKGEKFVAKYLDDGWAEVHRHWTTIVLKDGTAVRLSHLPYDNSYDTRYAQYKIPNDGVKLLHGHLHCKYRKNFNQIDVGFDGDLKLWSEDEIIKLITDISTFIPTPITEFYRNRTDKREFEVM